MFVVIVFFTAEMLQGIVEVFGAGLEAVLAVLLVLLVVEDIVDFIL